MKLDNNIKEIYEQAIKYTKKQHGDCKAGISAGELKQLEKLAKSDGNYTQQEKEFIEGLGNKMNVAKLAALNSKHIDHEISFVDFVPNKGSKISDETLKKRYECLINKGFDINNLDKRIEKLISTNLTDKQFSQIMSLTENNREIYLQLNSKNNVDPQKILDTLKYIDSVQIPFEDLKALITNQFSEKRSPADVLSAMQSFAIIKESLNLNPPLLNKNELEHVAEALKAGKIRVHEDININIKKENEFHAVNMKNLGDLNVGYYTSETDTLSVGNMDIHNPERRGLILHELVHASQDIKHAKAGKYNKAEAETEGYLAQGMYLLNSDKPPFTEAQLKKPANLIEQFTFAARLYAIAYINVQNLPPDASDAERQKALKACEDAKEKMIRVMEQKHSPYGCCMKDKHYDYEGVKGYNP